MMTQSNPLPEESVGLLLSKDLIFTSKITGTARELGQRVMVAGQPTLATKMLEQWKPRVVFVDLSAGELVSPAAILAYRQIAPEARFVAFGSHVDAQALATAKDAGCHDVMARSRFSANLPDLIRAYFDLEQP